SRQRVRPYHAVSRLQEQIAGSRPRRKAAAGVPGSGRSNKSREHSSPRSRNRASFDRGSVVHQSKKGRSDSSKGRTAPATRSTAFGPACKTIRSEQTWGKPGSGRWHTAETSAVIRRSVSSEQRTTMARQG